MFKKFIFLLITLYVSPAHASLIFTVDNITTDELTFSINGTFDEDTVGAVTPGVVAIKYDWSNNFGVHTEFMNGEPTVVSSTLTADGVLVDLNVDSAIHSTTDSIYFYNPAGNSTAFTAGTEISGSATLELTGGFDPALASGLELLSGYTMVLNTFPEWDYDWARLEAKAQVLSTPPTPPYPIPAPATFLLMVSGVVVMSLSRSRAQFTNTTSGLIPVNA